MPSLLSQEFIFSAMDAEKRGEVFPIDLTEIYQVAGYSRERDARRRILNSRLSKDIDFRDVLSESTGGRPSNKLFLSVDGFKSFLLAANTDEGEEARRYFIEVEKCYRQQLENLFQSQASDTYGTLRDRDLLNNALNDAESEILVLRQKLEQSFSNHQTFSFSAKFLHDASGIVSFPQVKSAIKRDFVEGRDWILVGKDIYLNESTFNILVVSFRSVRGVNLVQLPEIIRLETKLYFQYQEMRRKNRRVAQCDGQLALNFEAI